jgi:2,4-diaminopentanoate dehydrogenase
MGMAELRVGIVGLGPIGLEVARAILGRRELTLVAAVDVSPQLAGKPLEELLPGAPKHVKIASTLDAALASGKIDAVALTTTSRFSGIIGDLETAIRRRVHVASTCEEMAAPAVDPQTWARLDDHAKHSDVTLLGTGVNPGFVMDRLPLQLAGACVSVARVRVDRVVDAAKRRGPLRKKVGEGISPEEFRAGVAEKRLGHVGLRESALLIARGLGWKLESYSETIDPVVGDDGKCLGIRQRGIGIVGGTPRIELSLDMYVGAPNPHDRVQLEADPPIDMTIAGGTQGDRGTVGTTVNALARMRSAPRGLVTVADVFV